jgi:hypothetical protein
MPFASLVARSFWWRQPIRSPEPTTELSHAMPEVFGPVPEVVTGLMQEDAERI